MKAWLRSQRGFLIFLALFGVFRTAVADWNPIPSGSMRPTLLEGDVVLVNRMAYDLKLPLTRITVWRRGEPVRGEVITFESPVDGMRLIKRVVAVPGDVVSMREGRLTINGEPAGYDDLEALDAEPLAPGYDTPALRVVETLGASHRRIQFLPLRASLRSFEAVTVGPDQVMVLGDSRDNSVDSRVYGLVPRHLIIGHAHRVLVSADTSAWRLRLERLGLRL